MSVSPLKFGAVFVAPQTASNALNTIVSNQDFRKQNPVGPNLLGRQFLAGLTGVERIRDGAPVFFVPMNVQMGLSEPAGQDYLKNHGVETGDLVVVTGRSIGNIQRGETPEHFVLKELMFEPLEVRLLPEKQVEKTLDELLPFYMSTPGTLPASLLTGLQTVHNQAHQGEKIDLKPAQQVRTTADALSTYATVLLENARQEIERQQKQTAQPVTSMPFIPGPRIAPDAVLANQAGVQLNRFA